MGGGDLNSKKSWHPNTIKNQERVWKAEKAAAVEKQRIAELQRERAEERDRSELNDLARQTADASGDNRLSWMYNKPDKKGHQEDYLLGKTIDSNFDDNKEQQDAIPAVSRRVVGSSMMSGAGDTQVDLARKMREDPLLLVKERERAARAALLNNPLQRKKLTELLRREQEQRKEKKAPKKKHKDLDDKLAAKLNALGDDGLNLAALLASGDSSSESCSSDEKSKKKKHKKEKKSKKKKKEKKSKKKNTAQESSNEDDDHHRDRGRREQQSKDESSNRRQYDKDNHSDIVEKRRATNSNMISKYNSQSSGDRQISERCSSFRGYRDLEKDNVRPSQGYSYRCNRSPDDNSNKDRRDHVPSHRRRSSSDERGESKKSKRRSRSTDNDQIYSHRDTKNNEKDHRKLSQSHSYGRGRSRSNEKNDRRIEGPRKRRSPSEDRRDIKKPNVLSAVEREARLAEMARAGALHERERGARVAQQRAAGAAEDAAARRPRAAPATRALPASLESRIHSNRHNIQRNERHMNEHFARR